MFKKLLISTICFGAGIIFLGTVDNAKAIDIHLPLIGHHAARKPMVEVHKGPYLIYTGVNTQMQVLWQLYATAVCTIDWGTDMSYSDGSQQTTEYGTDHQHKITLTNLTPATQYYYRVTANGEIHTGNFNTAPDNSATNLKFLAYGDTRSYPATHNQVAAAIISAFTLDPGYQSLLISVGDLVNSGTIEADWDAQFFSPTYANIQNMLARMPYQSAMGNHEGNGVLFMKYFPYPYVSPHYWSFDYGPAHFAIVDQYISYITGSPQLNWLTNDLANSTKPWKFIVLHEPGWSAGDHANNTSVQNYIQPLCIQYHVPIVFAGHNHYYARAVVNGVQHLTIGGGGAPLYQPIPSYPNIVTTSMSYHYCKIEITDRVLKFAAITSAGATIDTFTLGSNCQYMPGDINSDGVRVGGDVTYGVRYFKGISAAPPDSCYLDSTHSYLYVAGDVNGNCLFQGSDITRLVAYFKGLTDVSYCHFFPPPPLIR